MINRRSLLVAGATAATGAMLGLAETPVLASATAPATVKPPRMERLAKAVAVSRLPLDFD